MAPVVVGILARRLQTPSSSILIHCKPQTTILRSSIRHTSTSTSAPQPSMTTTPAADLPPLTYHVHRTPGQQLPIYHLAKAGGNKHLTRIRKISGNVQDLKAELKEALDLADKEIIINNVNGHILIKGWRKIEVARFLEGKHF